MADDAPSLIALAGPNGAGKSTAGPPLLRDALGLTEFVNADVIAQGLSAFDPEGAAFEAGRVMLQRIRDLGRRRVSFAFETTLAGRSYVRWLSKLRVQGYVFEIFSSSGCPARRMPFPESPIGSGLVATMSRRK